MITTLTGSTIDNNICTSTPANNDPHVVLPMFTYSVLTQMNKNKTP